MIAVSDAARAAPALRAVALAAVLAGAGCSTQPGAGAAGDAAQRLPRAAHCFRVMGIDDWHVVDDRRLVVQGPGRHQAWQLTMFGSCSGLRHADVLAFRARSSSFICGDPGDEIIWRENRCSIRSVRAISPAEMKMLLDRNVRDDIGKMPPRDDDKHTDQDTEDKR